eukprot:CAMPEP_0117420344 /NCGR_PEP_ID=MMETSP0758-20121206/1695_1 /TAXON_ID=63605 /ORGANISM="Percolomonas cosmopolitus, Strain AE-1 (ATCC 50343)" /LENGTH=113 /DNA_ID=CAMNT_0005201893 /DNA_START=249 /DNA_END=590 /DNA_ORIENTATION=-
MVFPCDTPHFIQNDESSFKNTIFKKSNPPKYTALYGIIPITEIPNPLYSDFTPPSWNVFFRQSPSPEYVLFPPFPKSVVILVLAKSNGYTNASDDAPAPPPASNPRKNACDLL